ncbi:hypothetical protein EW093_09945 [Thiospirochaeta perfilievii]|uniref:Uncharacterized protein n=1 Tax=Thiospirochaeta perfilievii TaxID=252967 RepID=A0A5C1QBX0_9SPIO|nr:hypothetical protein [Thiospirochaeta perfilievii]QEN05017.1 hypothetical protein EW093_09945 [Thiospirochaeta perfilievii]
MISSVSSQIGSFSNYIGRIENSSKIEVPVPSSISVYAQFKYVRGVPAAANQQPVSLSRAQIIDNMVSYLNNSAEDLSLDKSSSFEVEELESEVHRVINEDPPNFNSLPGSNLDSGVIFSLTA